MPLSKNYMSIQKISKSAMNDVKRIIAKHGMSVVNRCITRLKENKRAEREVAEAEKKLAFLRKKL